MTARDHHNKMVCLATLPQIAATPPQPMKQHLCRFPVFPLQYRPDADDGCKTTPAYARPIAPAPQTRQPTAPGVKVDEQIVRHKRKRHGASQIGLLPQRSSTPEIADPPFRYSIRVLLPPHRSVECRSGACFPARRTPPPAFRRNSASVPETAHRLVSGSAPAFLSDNDRPTSAKTPLTCVRAHSVRPRPG